MLKSNNKTDLENLVENEDWQGAKSFLENILNEPMTSKERGWVYLNLAMIYIRLNNLADKNFDSLLDTFLALNQKIKKTEEKVAIEKLKESLL